MRHHWYSPLVSLLLAGVAILGGRAFARQSEEPATVILGTVASDPGTTATIPLYYKPGAARSIRNVHLELEFVSNSVKFSKAEKGFAAETQNFDLAVSTKEVPPDGNIRRTRLSIDVSVTDADAGKSLPEGLWTLLDFHVPTDAKAFAIALNPIASTAQDVDKEPVKLMAEPGKIIVSVPDEPLAGCLFFTH